MRSRVIENLQKINSVSDLVVTSDEGDNEENDSKRVIKGVFKFKSVTFRFLEIAKDENSLVVLKLNFEFLINKKISELEILRVINLFSASSPLIKTRYVGNESKKTQVIFTQEMLSFGENDSPTLLLSSLSILSIAPILFSNVLNENNFPHRSVTEN